MTLFLNAAIEPGFVAVERAGGWTWKPLVLGRGGPFPGVVVEELGVDVRALRAIVVVHGPGSSTGLRTVCAYANALAQVSGATLAICTSFDLVHMLHPAHPTVLAFPQPLGRTVVATHAQGAWSTEEPATIPKDAWHFDPHALTVDAAAVAPLVQYAQPVEVAIPRYWAAPLITRPSPRSAL